MPEMQPYDHDHENEVTLFANTNFRNQRRTFGIKTDDRRRHIYIIGKTGMGKTTLLENMVLSDINAGHGVAYVDPHGDTAQKILDFIPPHRINDVVYFNPTDLEYPMGFNVFETVNESQKHLVASGLMGVFKKIWPDVWSARMEYILLNTVLALLDSPGSTLLGINRMLSDKEYRKKVVSLIQDPVVKAFWVTEFAAYADKFRTEAVAPVQNKVGQFLSAAIIRNIVAQVKSTINIRDIMDSRKIFILNLSKGLIGEENSRLLGAMIITRLQLAAMERVDVPEGERQDFYLYVDEFQNFATESFANILSEARKYRLNLIMAHQYIDQLDEMVRSAVFGNVGTLISFRVGAVDAEFLSQEFAPLFTAEDLVNLNKYDVYLKLMINGAASEPFSASTLPPIARRTGSEDKVIKVSRERYARPRKTIEEKVLRWSGLGVTEDDEAEETVQLTEEEVEAEKEMERLRATSPKIPEVEPPAKKKKPAFEIPCSVCGKMQQLTFEPDWSRPWYCKEHLHLKQDEEPRRPSAPRPGRREAGRREPGRREAGDRKPRKKERPARPERPQNLRSLDDVVLKETAEEGVSLSSLMGGAAEKGEQNGSRDRGRDPGSDKTPGGRSADRPPKRPRSDRPEPDRRQGPGRKGPSRPERDRTGRPKDEGPKDSGSRTSDKTGAEKGAPEPKRPGPAGGSDRKPEEPSGDKPSADQDRPASLKPGQVIKF